ncbi:Uncharacterised protein [Vibrio cholerae]|uniref:Uncharacterized protein n=1 Tax=Vibrio cholerae TaxID=666 RepID=A0A655XWP0_VIBCL|nr:Uncharacterised protein [Vibrio cholerae]
MSAAVMPRKPMAVFMRGKRFLSPSKIAKSWPLCLWSNTHFLRPSGKS